MFDLSQQTRPHPLEPQFRCPLRHHSARFERLVAFQPLPALRPATGSQACDWIHSTFRLFSTRRQ